MSFENPIWLYLAPAAALGAGALIAFGLRQHHGSFKNSPQSAYYQASRKRLPATHLHQSCTRHPRRLCWESRSPPQYGVKWSEQRLEPRPRLRSGQLKKHAGFGHPPHTARSSEACNPRSHGATGKRSVRLVARRTGIPADATDSRLLSFPREP